MQVIDAHEAAMRIKSADRLRKMRAVRRDLAVTQAKPLRNGTESVFHCQG
jgi:hypothetical protein